MRAHTASVPCQKPVMQSSGTQFLLVTFTAIACAFGSLAQDSAREFDKLADGTAPTWSVAPQFKKDTFTFVRIKYQVNGRHGFERL